jgi:CDP-glycerol glycerophosphotransferase (TagB/SpsB family)
MKNFFRELSQYYRFAKKTLEEDKKIVFYAEHAGYYPNYEGLIEELTNKRKLTICYISSDPEDSILKTDNPRIKPFYIKNLLAFLMAFIKCRVFVMTLTDLNTFHLKRSVNPVHYVYVYHAMVSTHMMYLPGAFDHYDSILCVGKHHVEELRKAEEMKELPQKQLVEGGYYRLERIYSKYKKYLQTSSSEKTGTTVLIAPSWGKGNVLESFGDELVAMLLDKNLNVIVRPHPETVKRTPELLNAIEGKYGDNSALTIERSVATDDSLLKSDVLICDCSGIALEYAFGTERPVLFLDVPRKIRNENYQELGLEPIELSLRSEIGILVSPEDLATVPEKIETLISEKKKYIEQISLLRKKYVYGFGRSSQIGAEHILDLLK